MLSEWSVMLEEVPFAKSILESSCAQKDTDEAEAHGGREKVAAITRGFDRWTINRSNAHAGESSA